MLVSYLYRKLAAGLLGLQARSAHAGFDSPK